MEFMKGVPDKEYDLAIVDPPYGIGEDGKGTSRSRGGQVFTNFEKKGWDNKKPDAGYFRELFRVSHNQVIWGGNYFTEHLPGKMGWIFWDKLLGGDFSDGELAYTSYDRALRKFTKSPEKNYSTNAFSAKKYKRIHPCQKPIKLYEWVLKNYSPLPRCKILDTHGGSMSIAIACYNLSFDLDLCELDPDYFKAGKERFDAHVAKYAPAAEIPVTKKGEIKLF